uniref:Uncharacterized protein n=1 Tax=Cacopsylla melanoneura TaxID=428564 RepID=A0A8D8QU38_9HEMI
MHTCIRRFICRYLYNSLFFEKFTCTHRKALEGHTYGVAYLAWSPDGSNFVSSIPHSTLLQVTRTVSPILLGHRMDLILYLLSHILHFYRSHVRCRLSCLVTGWISSPCCWSRGLS